MTLNLKFVIELGPKQNKIKDDKKVVILISDQAMLDKGSKRRLEASVKIYRGKKVTFRGTAISQTGYAKYFGNFAMKYQNVEG